MPIYLRTILVGVFCFFALKSLVAQTSSELKLNGVLFEVTPEFGEQSQQEFIWSMELENLATDIEKVVTSDEEIRLNVVFLNNVDGASWRRFWSEHMRRVYARSLGQVNDHADAFFKIISGFPESFNKGDRFSVQTAAQQDITRVFLNNELITQSHKPGHFEFWLRAWRTGEAMPDIFLGDLLSGGSVEDYLLVAHQKSQSPKVFAPKPELAPKKVVESRNQDEQQGDRQASSDNVKAESSIKESPIKEKVDSRPVVSVIIEDHRTISPAN